jgi:hypothetical protein
LDGRQKWAASQRLQLTVQRNIHPNYNKKTLTVAGGPDRRGAIIADFGPGPSRPIANFFSRLFFGSERLVVPRTDIFPVFLKQVEASRL